MIKYNQRVIITIVSEQKKIISMIFQQRFQIDFFLTYKIFIVYYLSVKNFSLLKMGCLQSHLKMIPRNVFNCELRILTT